MPILCVGSIALDTVETPEGRAEEALGGSLVYFACAGSLFTQIRLVGVVGRDFPDRHIEFLRARGVDLAGLEVRDGETFRWHGRYHADMNVRDTVSVRLNVFGEFDPVLPPAFADSEYVFLGNCRPALQAKVLGQVRGRKFVMADTMNLWVENHRTELEDLLRRVDGVLMNDEEARLLTGRRNLILAGEEVLRRGPRVLVIKKGEHGALLFADGRCAPFPAFPTRRVVDPTGAGDSFAGGLLGFLAAAGEVSFDALRRAVAYAAVLASFTVEDFGLERLRRVTRREVDGRFDEYRRMLAL